MRRVEATRVRVGEIVELEVCQRGGYTVAGAVLSDGSVRKVRGVVQGMDKASSGCKLRVCVNAIGGVPAVEEVHCLRGACVSVVSIDYATVDELAVLLICVIVWGQIWRHRGEHPMLNSRQRSFIYAPKMLTAGRLARLTGSQEQAELLATLCYEWDAGLVELIDTVRGLAA